MPRSYLIAGANGMLGNALQRVVLERGERFVAPAEGDFDITDADAVTRVVRQFGESLGPDESGVFVNAAAYTNVERAEDEPEIAHLVNGWAPGMLAKAALREGVRFAHVSTDFVFDGRKAGAYFEDDETNPLSVYGASKLEGERSVAAAFPDALVVRTAWVFGSHGANFPLKVLSAGRERGSLSVVNDESGSPTYTVDLARGILGLLDAGATGLYHLAGAGSCTRFELAGEVLRIAGLGAIPVEPVLSSAFPTKAERPKNSVLDCGKAAGVGVVMPEWRDALARFLAEVDVAG